MRNPKAPFVTLSGLPLRMELQWPFHSSTSGADWFSLHGRAWLDDDSGLHADVAINLTQTIKDALPSLEPEHAESAIVNAIRKEFDVLQLELLKSGKRQPVTVSSRHYWFKQNRLIFAKAGDEAMRSFLRRKIYWTAARAGRDAKSWLTDPFDLEYLNVSAQQIVQAAQALASEGLVTVEGEYASATDALMQHAAEIEGEKNAALKALEEKHAYERG
jgi:hypothetical protein